MLGLHLHDVLVLKLRDHRLTHTLAPSIPHEVSNVERCAGNLAEPFCRFIAAGTLVGNMIAKRFRPAARPAGATPWFLAVELEDLWRRQSAMFRSLSMGISPLRAHATLLRQLETDLFKKVGLALANFDVLAQPGNPCSSRPSSRREKSVRRKLTLGLVNVGFIGSNWRASTAWESVSPASPEWFRSASIDAGSDTFHGGRAIT